jgi:hypothetical protein
MGPITEQSTSFYLLCGIGYGTSRWEPMENVRALARENVICVTLRLKDSIWQREPCDRFDAVIEPPPANPHQLTEIYVRQGGL